jgi:ABC-type branched-subunit amino acid transport system substrate-binding protein
VVSKDTPFTNLAASEFRAAAARHGIQVSSGKPGKVAVAPGGAVRAIYRPGTAGLVVYGNATQVLELSAELDPNLLPDREFAARFAQRFHRDPGPYAAYGHEAMALVLEAIRAAGDDASSFRDDVRGALVGAQRDDTVLGSYSITPEGETTECMIQRYRIARAGAVDPDTATPNVPTRVPLGAACPPR